MSGVFRLLLLPLAAVSLLLVGCGVAIAPEAITATAVAEQEAAARQASQETFGGGASNDRTLSASAASTGVAGSSLQAVQPLSALATSTPTILADEDPVDSAEGTEDPEAEYLGDGVEDPDVSETPTEVPSETPVPEPTATPEPIVANVNQGFAQEFLTLLNAQRTGRGLGALTLNATLTSSGTQYAAYMGTANFFGHDGPDGSTAGSRAAASGYAGAWNGEALSAGQPTPQMALNALLASPPHAAILLDPRSGEVGIGYAFVQGSRYLHYWVVMTGIP